MPNSTLLRNPRIKQMARHNFMSLVRLGETRFDFTRDDIHYTFKGLVVKNLDVDVLTGIPFMEINDFAVSPSKRTIKVGDHAVYQYGSKSTRKEHSAFETHIHVLRAVASNTIWPGG
jgi:hypothetical protein